MEGIEADYALVEIKFLKEGSGDGDFVGLLGRQSLCTATAHSHHKNQRSNATRKKNFRLVASNKLREAREKTSLEVGRNRKTFSHFLSHFNQFWR